MHTLVICDTEPIAIEGLRSLLEAAEGLRVVATESSLQEASAAVRELRPSILLVDKALGFNAIAEWLESLRTSGSNTATIVWGSIVSEPESLRLLHAGAAGVIRKTVPLNTLLSCMRTVAAGGAWVEDCVLPATDSGARDGHSRLTVRETQVIRLVERGLKNKDIAKALGISPGTVKIHLKHIFEKTGIRGRYGLAVSALREKSSLAAAAHVV